MAILTASLLIGSGRDHVNGVDPTDFLFLAENGRLAWILVPENLSKTGDPPPRPKVIWIPSDEDLLEDGLLMLAIHVLANEEIISLARDIFRNPDFTALQIMKQIKPDYRQMLYDQCRKIRFHTKIVMTVMEGSKLLDQVPILERYLVDVDVCVPRYSRFYSHAEGTMVTRGFFAKVKS